MLNSKQQKQDRNPIFAAKNFTNAIFASSIMLNITIYLIRRPCNAISDKDN